MKWNIKYYEEPGILFGDREVEADTAPMAQVMELLKPGLDEGRVALAVLSNLDSDEGPVLCPESPVVDLPFEELADKMTELLQEQRPFAAVSLVDGALKGAHKDDPEVKLIAASVYEHVSFHEFAVRLLQEVYDSFDDPVRKLALQVRLARALFRSGRQNDVRDLLKEPLEHPELPSVLKAEGLLLKAICAGPVEGLEVLDEMLDYTEEALGDHRLVADALELHADYLAASDPKKAEQFYHAAGKMLVSLRDPYFFSLNERFVMHFLRQKAYKEALDLSHEMFEMLKQAGGPPIASVPYFVFAGRAHKELGNQERSEFATKTAREIHPVEARRIEEMVEMALA